MTTIEKINKARIALGLLNSMVACGEKHSEESTMAVEEGRTALRSLAEDNRLVKVESALAECMRTMVLWGAEGDGIPGGEFLPATEAYNVGAKLIGVALITSGD